MNREVVEILMLIDNSGSMMGKTEVAKKGYNDFIHYQVHAVNGVANITTYYFSSPDDLQKKYSGNIVRDEGIDDYAADGTSTAILDALGKSVTKLEEKLAYTLGHSDDSRVIVVLITDGEENSSETWDSKSIEELIERKKRHQWKFMYIGPDYNREDEYNDVRMSFDEVVELDMADVESVENSFLAASKSITQYRES